MKGSGFASTFQAKEGLRPAGLGCSGCEVLVLTVGIPGCRE